MNSIRVVLVDEHPAILHGLTRLLQQTPDLEVTAAACSAAEAIETTRSAPPDVIVVDLSMQPTGTGLGLVRRFSHAPMNARVLAFGDAADPGIRQAAAHAGAAGLLSPSADLDTILTAIRRTGSDESGFALFDIGPPSVAGSSDAECVDEGLSAAR